MNVTPRLDRKKARITARGMEEARRFQRLELPLEGVFLDADDREHACTIVDLSPGGARIAAGHKPVPGALTVVHVDHFGHLEAETVRRTGDGFSVRWLAGPRRRERLAEQLIWKYNAPRLGLGDDRAGVRDKRRGEAKILFDDGAEVKAKVADVSATGIAFRSEFRPRPGLGARIGRLTGEVSRHTADGFAVRLDPPARGTKDTDAG